MASIIASGVISVLAWRMISRYRRHGRAKTRVNALRKTASDIRKRMGKISLHPESGRAKKGVLMASYDSLLKAEEALSMAKLHNNEPFYPRLLEIAAKEAEVNLAMSTILLQTFDGYEEWPAGLRLQQSSQECLYAIAEALWATSRFVPEGVAPVLHEAAEVAKTCGDKARTDPIGAISDFQEQVREIFGGLITIDRKI